MDKIKQIFLALLVSIHFVQANGIDLDKMLADSTYAYSEQELLLLLGVATVYVQDTSVEKQIMADRLFSTVATQIEKKLVAKEIKKDEANFCYIQRVLEDYQYHIRIPVSDAEKFIHYLKEGRFDYIWHRIVGRGYLLYIIIIALISLSLLTIIWKRWIRITAKTSS